MKIATWNINSVRLREGLVQKLLGEETPDILCLQEIKTPIDKFPTEGFAAMGYRHLVARGQKGYNGVAILSVTRTGILVRCSGETRFMPFKRSDVQRGGGRGQAPAGFSDLLRKLFGK